jgi:hypothetical protein
MKTWMKCIITLNETKSEQVLKGQLNMKIKHGKLIFGMNNKEVIYMKVMGINGN